MRRVDQSNRAFNALRSDHHPRPRPETATNSRRLPNDNCQRRRLFRIAKPGVLCEGDGAFVIRPSAIVPAPHRSLRGHGTASPSRVRQSTFPSRFTLRDILHRRTWDLSCNGNPVSKRPLPHFTPDNRTEWWREFGFAVVLCDLLALAGFVLLFNADQVPAHF